MNDYSRPLRFAQATTGTDTQDLEQRLAEKEIVVSLEADCEGAVLTARTLLTTLARLPGTMVLARNDLPDAIVTDLCAAVAAIGGDELRLDAGGVDAIRVHVGIRAPAGAIRAVPEGYGAHVSSDPAIELTVRRPASPLGAIYAAALGAAEVFKLAAGVPTSRAPLHRHLSFCPVTLSTDLQRAPDLNPGSEIDLALIGVGAVGTATALIMSELELRGMILLVDRERFAAENIATYSLGGRNDVDDQSWKVDLAANALQHRYTVKTTTDPVEALPTMIDEGNVAWPRAVLSGLDSIAARHATQRLWPDLLIDAATGDTMVGIHVSEPNAACLMCHLPPLTTGPSSIERLAAATGLPIDLLVRGDNALTDADLERLTVTQQNLLRPHLGKPICGLANALGLTGIDSSYQPAIPFAAQQAACLGVGRLIAHLLGFYRSDNVVQHDAFRGPSNATVETRQQLNDCYCQERAATISRVRAIRAAQTPGAPISPVCGGAVVEQRGRNRRQSMARCRSSESAEISPIRCHGSRGNADDL